MDTTTWHSIGLTDDEWKAIDEHILRTRLFRRHNY